MKHLDLFSGIGGFALAAQRVGWETVAFCENDPYCRGVLEKHWPDVPIHHNIEELCGYRGAADVITGGFPCQDISIAGAQVGIDGRRSRLWAELARVISEIRPRYAVVENVSALLSGDRGRWFGRILGDLAALGYDAEWHCIPASAVGAPHRRDRIWVIAYPASGGDQLLTDTASARLERRLQAKNTRPTQRFLAGRAFLAGASWPDAPDVPRVGYGLPDWAHRIKGCGNAIVPQVAEVIFRALPAQDT